MRLADYYRLRDGVQRNAAPADDAALAELEHRLRHELEDSGLFHTVEVERTGDPDRLLIAMVGFAPEVARGGDVAAALTALWRDHLAHRWWATQHLIVEHGHVELQGSTRRGATGDYVTVHLLAQQAAAPATVAAPAPVRQPEAVVAPVLQPAAPRRTRARAWGRGFALPVRGRAVQA